MPSIFRHCIRSKQRTKTPCISATHSSSQSSSLAGEQVDVKVEITPPRDTESVQVSNSNSFSIDSAPNLGLSLSDFKTSSPQQRKLSELPTDTLLSAAANFGRLTPSPSSASSSCKLYKKFEDFLDLSLPYNHYRCLSPSESNLTQCNDGKYIYGVSRLDNKPGSSRLLRRQFSLDKDDCQNNGSGPSGISMKSSLDVPFIHDISTRSTPSPTNVKPARLHKQNSASLAQDLGKIEEIPASPTSCIFNYHSSHLSQIPGSAAGSPASKKLNDTQNVNQISTIATLEVPATMMADTSSRAVSPISANTICSNSGDSISEQSNNNGNICFHI